MEDHLKLSISFSDLQGYMEKTLTSILEKYLSSYQTNNDKNFTPAEAADYLRISKVTLWKLNKEKIIPCIRIGKVVLYRKSDIDRVLSERSSLKPSGNR